MIYIYTVTSLTIIPVIVHIQADILLIKWLTQYTIIINIVESLSSATALQTHDETETGWTEE